MSDIILVYPKTGFDIPGLSVDLPLSILSAASIAEQNYSVKLIDQRTDNYWQNTLQKELSDNPMIVGISAMTGRQIKYGLEIAELARKSGFRGSLIWGGVHPSLLPEQTLKNPLVDIVVMGEGEVTLNELALALDKGEDLSKIDGIAYKKNEVIHKNKARDLADINQLPPLPYHLTVMDNYIGSQGRYENNDAKGLIFISSRGCPWQCSFCCNPKLSGRKWRSMEASLVSDHITELKNKFKINAITFHDEEFLVDKHRAESISELIGGRMDWWVQARMDRLLKVDIDKLAAGGLKAVQPGIESGSDRILEMIRKGESVSLIKEANRRLASTPIAPLYNFMMGFPSETKEELNDTVDLALNLIEENKNAEVSGFYAYVPYPGTELFDNAVSTGFTSPTSLVEWSDYSRQQLMTPWIQDKKEDLENIMFSSKFIDGKRLAKRVSHIFPSLPLTQRSADFMTGRIRKKWRSHDYSDSLDLKIFKKAAKHFLT